MIVIDTNVLSAVMQSRPDAQVTSWLDEQRGDSIWITCITLFEARYGLALLPTGKRKSLLQERFEEMLQDDLGKRVLPFDETAAVQAARLAAQRKTLGRPVDLRDTFIAGIAISKRATLATRNVRHFENLSVLVINPWDMT